jgi:hypothetical protein
MTELLVFSKMDNDPITGGSQKDSINETNEQTFVGGLSVTGLLKKKKNDMRDSKLYSFFENLAVPIGLTCYKDDIVSTDGHLRDDENKEESNDGVIKSDLFDRLFNMSSINLARGKARRTRKKIPQ